MRHPRRYGMGVWLVRALVIIAVCAGAAPRSVFAQNDGRSVQRIQAVEPLFEEGLDAFERGDYETAYWRFRRVTQYPVNQKTTAALLMAGKALYQLEEYDEAQSVMQAFMQRFPNSRYREEARRVLGYARDAREMGQQNTEVIRLGVALPLGEWASLTQALFNGIRLAVEERNGVQRRLVPVDTTYYTVADTIAMAGDSSIVQMKDTMRVERAVELERVAASQHPVRMFFRDSGNNAERARAAVDSLIRYDRVDAIIGPLFSHEVRAAGAAAERQGVVLIAPVATDEDIARGRRFVFQANPPIRTRGEIMARFAVRSLLADTLGLIIEQGNMDSARMAEGFRVELQRQDATLAFDETLPNPRMWPRLPEHFEADSLFTPDTLRGTDSIYMPILGQNAGGRIQDALTGLREMQIRYGLRARALGNSEWHNLAIEREASRFNTIYTNDFFADQRRPEVRDFVRRYRLLTGETPDEIGVSAQRLSYTGYDVASFLLEQLERGPTARLGERLRNTPRYEGLGTRIDFQGGNVNRTMFIHRYQDGRIELIR